MRHSVWVTGLGAGFLALGLAGAALSGDAEDLPKSEVQRGLAIAPVQLNLKGKNRALVGKGSYIVNAQGGCNDCHTFPSYAEGGNPFQGQPEQINTDHYLAGGTPFGDFTSRNLTPDATGKPGGMTFEQFKKILRTGRDRADQPLRVMPWPVYGKMTDKDLKAVYTYLSAIPSAEPPAPAP